jgi:putative protease
MSSSPVFPKPEIMSPAGYWPQLRAAIEAGADSVYFGLNHFSARAKVGFGLDELPEALRTLHARGVKGYVTFNTLVFDHELEAAARGIAAIAAAGADAIIVQDLGIARVAHEIAPELEIHASTQMSITNADGVRLAERMGARRVTLARELSLAEVAAIRAETSCPLEIFVHGALCVAYSGQCLSSEAWGGRSANRGQCAQACRLPYEMMVDGVHKPLADARYLLSPGDLYAVELMPEIVRTGVSALKIEGRYKDAEYVAAATQAYRRAVDAACLGGAAGIDPREKRRLEQVYSRGLGPFFLSGTDHQAVVRGRAPRHRGLLMGQVVTVGVDSVLVTGTELKPGDGVVFDAADWRSPEEPEEGGRVFSATARRGGLELQFGNGAVNFARIRPGDLVWRTHDPDVEKEIRPLVEAPVPVRRQVVHVRATGRAGQVFETVWTLSARPEVRAEVASEAVLGSARNRALDEEMLREQFGRLGNTPYELGAIELTVEGLPFAPASVLNQMRRRAVDELQRLQRETARLEIRDPAAALAATREQARPGRGEPAATAGDPQLHLLVRTAEQLDAALDLRPPSITLDYLDLYGLRPSVERVKASGVTARVAAPRIFKPGEERIVNFLAGLDCAILVRSAGLLDVLRGRPHAELTGDFSLNAANVLTADLLLELGLERLTPAHDLNAEQVAALARGIGAEAIEAVAFQHLPVFHTEHCVFARFLSNGSSYKDCGRPCERHSVELRDAGGRAHPVMADVGCRNTVFGAEAQQAAAHLEAWRAAGIRHFRLEFVHESAEQVKRVTQAFAEVLTGGQSARQLQRKLAQIAPQGVTEGSLFVPAGYQQLPVLQ